MELVREVELEPYLCWSYKGQHLEWSYCNCQQMERGWSWCEAERKCGQIPHPADVPL